MNLVLTLLFLLPVVVAHPIPIPNNPAPLILNTIVSAAEGTCDPRRFRTLWDIAYNCISTIAICTFFAIHHNIPDQNASTTGKVWQKVKTTLYAILAPEAVILWAMRQRFVASRIAEQYKGQGWTQAHGFFMQMGGFIFHDGQEYHVVTISPSGDIRVGDEDINMVNNKEVSWMPMIEEAEIQDKGNSDVIGKVVVIVQTSWFVLHCFARSALHLAITGLELVTLAFAALNIITYILWLNKPLNAQYPIYFNRDGERTRGPALVRQRARINLQRLAQGLRVREQLSQEEAVGWLGLCKVIALRFMQLLWRWLLWYPFTAVFLPMRDMIGRDTIRNRIWVGPYYAGRLGGKDKDMMVIASTIIGVAFGAIHLAGWNFQFPTEAERIIWRVTSVIITVEPALLGLHAGLHYVFIYTPPGRARVVLDFVTNWTFFFFALVGPIVYTLARITLLVQTLLALRDLPSSAYESVVWSRFMPHI
ncbi:hypothetical protein AX16_008368 [Volvariella volvacea WC 439]|nr:hypothetical protein AX16_008368 [Volvariella volvacea WC 439]